MTLLEFMMSENVNMKHSCANCIYHNCRDGRRCIKEGIVLKKHSPDRYERWMNENKENNNCLCFKENYIMLEQKKIPIEKIADMYFNAYSRLAQEMHKDYKIEDVWEKIKDFYRNIYKDEDTEDAVKNKIKISTESELKMGQPARKFSEIYKEISK